MIENKVEYIKKTYECSGSRIIEINNVTRLELANLIKKFGYQTGVEVGVYKGYFSRKIMEQVPEFRMYGVDPYMDYEGKLAGKPSDWEKEARERMSPFENYSFIKKPSIEAAKEFPDESLDFVYIDGDHEFAQVALDLSTWHRKVKKGGMIAGHDYYLPTVRRPEGNLVFHVKQAVEAFALSYKVWPLFILGRDGGSAQRDKIRSFFYIK